MDGLIAILGVVAGILAVIAAAIPLIPRRKKDEPPKDENISGKPIKQAEPDKP